MHFNDGKVISNFITQALQKKPITIFGDGSQTRSFCYIDDMIEAITRLMATANDCTGPMNLGNPVELTIIELAEKIVKLTGTRAEIVFRPLPMDDPRQRCPDISFAQQVLDWQPVTGIEDGLKETIHYFDKLLSLAT